MAETRETQVLEDVVESTEIENPRTTEEAILAQVIAGEEVTINARTRYQAYLKELSSISGGNPNYIETITGTLANPFNSYTVGELAYKANVENSINMFIVVDGSSLGLGVYPLSQMKPMDVSDNNKVYFGAVYLPSDTSKSMVADLHYNTSGLSSAKIMNGITTPTDMSPYADHISTTLTIIHHPLPEDNT